MEKQGYVTVQRGPRKGGPVKVAMTDKGKEAVDLAWEREQAVADIISSLSKQERDSLRAYLERIRDRAYAVASRPIFH
jgi:DNA-binding MarR family transcriptional regulator